MFRSSEYLERYEFTSIEPGTAIVAPQGDNAQVKNHRFMVDNVNEITPFDWYTAYFKVEFKVTNRDAGSTNLAANANIATAGSAFTLIKSLKADFNGLQVNDSNDIGMAANVKNLLDFNSSYTNNYGGIMFHYPDTSLLANSNEFGVSPVSAQIAGGGNGHSVVAAQAAFNAYSSRNVNYNAGFARRKLELAESGLVEATIPLNRYGFFESFKDKLCPPGRVSLNVTIDSDNDAIFAGAANTGRLIITKLVLWIARLTFNPLGAKTIMGGLTEPKEWTYLSEDIKSTLARRDTAASWTINASVERPRMSSYGLLIVTGSTPVRKTIHTQHLQHC